MRFRSGANSDLVVNNLKINGKLTLEQPLTYDDFTVETIEVTDRAIINDLKSTGELELEGDISANNTKITPVQLSYVSGATSNIQSQLNTKASTANPVFTGTVTQPTVQSNGFTYIGNDGTSLPTFNLSNYFGAIGSNMMGGDAELDFINTGHLVTNLSLPAFDWYIMTSSTAKNLLMRLYNNGGLLVNGLLNAVGGITTTTLTATGHSQFVDVSSGALTVTGDLHVSGDIYGSVQSNMEVLSYYVTGNASLKTTNYIVIPSIYDGLTNASGGTYNA